MTKTADAVTRSVILGAIPKDTNAWLGPVINSMKVRQILNKVEDKFIDNSEERHVELKAAAQKLKINKDPS